MTFGFDWAGSALGIIGALLLAVNTRFSALGWVAWFGSNLSWIGYGLQTNTASIAVQNLLLLGTTMLALWRYKGQLLAVISGGRTGLGGH